MLKANLFECYNPVELFLPYVDPALERLSILSPEDDFSDEEVHTDKDQLMAQYHSEIVRAIDNRLTFENLELYLEYFDENLKHRNTIQKYSSRNPLKSNKHPATWIGSIPEEKLQGLLGLVNLPDSREIVSGETDLVELASTVYGCKPDEVVSIVQDGNFNFSNRNNYGRFLVKFDDGTESDFYVKPSWNAPVIVDALGNALLNLLGDETLKDTYQSAACEETGTFASVGIEGKMFKDVKPEEFSDKATLSYGMAVELSLALGLRDRHDLNTLLRSDDVVVQIDFDTIFGPENPPNYERYHDFGAVKPTNTDLIEEGKLKAREVIASNYERHKGLISELISYAQHLGADFSEKPETVLSSYATNVKSSSLEKEVQ
jgi:hypothetical protein